MDLSCGSWLATFSRNWRTSDSMSMVRGGTHGCAGFHGKGEGEGAAFAGLAFHPDAAAVVFDDLLADGQAEAGAFGFVGERVADLLEFLEDFRLIGRRDADAGVGDADHQIAVCAARRNR